jgi:hypothetical protein
MKPAYTVIWKPSAVKSLTDYIFLAMTAGASAESITTASSCGSAIISGRRRRELSLMAT